MKFKISKKILKKNFDNIKKSKAFSKSEDNGVILKISALDDTLTLLCSNTGIWACSVINNDMYDDSEFSIIKNGDIYIEGSNFINIVNTYPDGVLDFSTEKEDDGKNRLVLNYQKSNQKKQSAFLIIATGTLKDNNNFYFDEEPPKEERKETIVNTRMLKEASQSVGFASSTNELEGWMWGVMIEIYSQDDIAAYATDRSRIAWYDEKGTERAETPISLKPIYTCLKSILPCFDEEENTKIEYGDNYIILSQSNQWHGIPNAQEVINSGDKLPEWRNIHNKIKQSVQTEITLNKEKILNCIQTASYASCKKHGLRISIDTNKKNIELAVDSTEVGGILRSYHKESFDIEDKDISGQPFSNNIFMPVDKLKEALSQYKSDTIKISLIDENSPIIIEGDETESVHLITTGLE